MQSTKAVAWDVLKVCAPVSVAPVLLHCFSNSVHAGLRLFYSGIPEDWPTLWRTVKAASHTPYFDSDIILIVVGAWVMHMLTFWCCTALFAFMDLTGVGARFKTTYSKVHEDSTKSKPSPLPFGKPSLLPAVLMNQALSLLLGLTSTGYIMKYRGISSTDSLPSFSQHFFHLTICILTEEVVYYTLHRMMHSIQALWNVHKQHHRGTTTAMQSMSIPLLEFLLLRMLPYSLGPLLCGCHISTLYIWAGASALVMTMMYSGYHFPLLSSPHAHLFHQEFYSDPVQHQDCECWEKGGCNFGSLGLMDFLCGTDRAFVESSDYVRHQVIWDLDTTPVRFPLIVPKKLCVLPKESHWSYYFTVPWLNSWVPALGWAAGILWNNVWTYKASTLFGLSGVVWMVYCYCTPTKSVLADPVMWSFILDSNIYMNGCYWLFVIMFLCVDGAMESLGLVGKYRMQHAPILSDNTVPDLPVFKRIDWKMWVHGVYWAMCNQVGGVWVLPLYTQILDFSTMLHHSTPMDGLPPFPAWYILIFQIVGAMVIADCWFWCSHRLNHAKFIYPYIHKQHHQLRTTVAAGGIACHPLEHCVVNLPTTLVGALVMQMNKSTYILWSCMAVINVVCSHSGYSLGITGGDPHDYYHWFLNCEFGAGGMMDFLFKTRYSDYKKLKRQNFDTQRQLEKDGEEKRETDGGTSEVQNLMLRTLSS